MFFIGDLGQAIYDFRGVTDDSLVACADAVGAVRISMRETYRCGPHISAAASKLQNGILQPAGRAADLIDGLCFIDDSGARALKRFAEMSANDGIAPIRSAVIAKSNDDVRLAAVQLREMGVAASVFSNDAKGEWFKTLVLDALRLFRDANSSSLATLRSTILDSFSVLEVRGEVQCALTFETLYSKWYAVRDSINLKQSVKEQLGTAFKLVFESIKSDHVLPPATIDAYVKSCRDEYTRIKAESPSFLNQQALRAVEDRSPRSSIRCMTIHLSKGLEFDAVLLVDCDEGRLPHYFHGAPSDIDGDRRKFFVAVTRAKRLFAAAAGSTPSQFLSEINLI